MKKFMCILVCFTFLVIPGFAFAVDTESVPLQGENFYWFSRYGDVMTGDWTPFDEENVSFSNDSAELSLATPQGANDAYIVMHPSGYGFATDCDVNIRLEYSGYTSNSATRYGNGPGIYLFSSKENKVVGIQLDPDGTHYSTWTMNDILSHDIEATEENKGVFILEKIGDIVSLYIEEAGSPILVHSYENVIAGDDIVPAIQLWTAEGVEAYIKITGLEISAPCGTSSTQDVSIDIKPGSCENPLNVKSKGVLPVAVYGTEDVQVYNIDIASISLNGISPIRSSFEDIGSPEDCQNGRQATADDYTDLVLKFDTQEIIGSLGDLNDGDEIDLDLVLNFSDGSSGYGYDSVRILKKGKR